MLFLYTLMLALDINTCGIHGSTSENAVNDVEELSLIDIAFISFFIS